MPGVSYASIRRPNANAPPLRQEVFQGGDSRSPCDVAFTLGEEPRAFRGKSSHQRVSRSRPSEQTGRATMEVRNQLIASSPTDENVTHVLGRKCYPSSRLFSRDACGRVV